MRSVTLRVFLFALQMSALVALMPLIARRMQGGGAGTFTMMLATMGVGAIAAAMLLPRWRSRFSRDQVVNWGTAIHGTASTLVALSPTIWIALPAMFVVGMAWISTANTFSTSAQLALPNWVRARGMAIYQMAMMGGTALGAVLFGNVAAMAGVQTAVISAAAAGLLLLPVVRRRSIGGQDAEYDLVPANASAESHAASHADKGLVMVVVEYQIDAASAKEFGDVMQLTRASRLRRGAQSWGFFRDSDAPGRYMEYFTHENWIEYRRQLARFNADDAALRDQRLAFHVGDTPPVRKYYVAADH